MEDKLDPEKLNREFRNLTSNVEKKSKRNHRLSMENRI